MPIAALPGLGIRDRAALVATRIDNAGGGPVSVGDYVLVDVAPSGADVGAWAVCNDGGAMTVVARDDAPYATTRLGVLRCRLAGSLS